MVDTNHSINEKDKSLINQQNYLINHIADILPKEDLMLQIDARAIEKKSGLMSWLKDIDNQVCSTRFS